MTIQPLLLAASPIQMILAPLVLLCVGGAGFYGFRQGMFRAALLGFGGLASIFLALGLWGPLAAWLQLVEVPAAYTAPGAFLGSFAVAAVVLLLAINAAVPTDAVRLAPRIDQIGGAIVGLVSGFIASGGVLLALSFAPLPSAYRPDFGRLALDTGAPLLAAFTRSLGLDGPSRDVVYGGEPGAAFDPAVKPRPTTWSEPFVDANANAVRDAEEPFLDTDGNDAFTPELTANDINGNGRRDVGLLEHYRLGDWRPLTVIQAPLMTGKDSAYVTDGAPITEVVYQAAATDVDPGDVLTYSLKADQDDGGLLAIDAATGTVTLQSPSDRETKNLYAFTVIVTDKAGLTAERQVTLHVTKPLKSDREPSPGLTPDPL
jgi:uncharacterized membrane protein required for colicin V production